MLPGTMRGNGDGVTGWRIAALGLIAFLTLTVSASTALGDDAVDSVLDNLEWRNRGPTIMGDH